MNYYVNLPILIGIVIFLIAIIASRNPPAKINLNYGYRTKRSMRNQMLWDHAQTIYPKVLMRGAIGLIVVGILLWLLGSSQIVVAITGVVGMFAVIVWVFVYVERILKRLDVESETN